MPQHPVSDPYRIAAQYCIEGDFVQAYNAIKNAWVERLTSEYEGPTADADEDGEYFSDPASDMRTRAATLADGYIDQEVADAVYELLEPQVGEDEAIRTAEACGLELSQEMKKHVDAIADDATAEWSDGAAFSKNPYEYYGVSRSDF